jgi:hypothetical protein
VSRNVGSGYIESYIRGTGPFNFTSKQILKLCTVIQIAQAMCSQLLTVAEKVTVGEVYLRIRRFFAFHMQFQVFYSL